MLRSPDVEGWSDIVAWFDCDDVDGWFDVVCCNDDDDRADVDGWSSIFLCLNTFDIGGCDVMNKFGWMQLQVLRKFNISEALIRLAFKKFYQKIHGKGL